MTGFIKILKSAADLFGDCLFTVRCPYCSKIIYRDRFACGECAEKFPPRPFVTYADGGCKTAAAFPYSGIFSKAVKDLKYKENPTFAKPLSLPLAKAICVVHRGEPIDMVTCVPMHRDDLIERGYNHSELIAKSCATRLRLPYFRLLEKHKNIPRQHTLDRGRRRQNVKNAFRPLNRINLTGKTVLIIDDIITTGCTLGECCRTLKKAGAKRVICAAVCSVRANTEYHKI